MTPAEFIERHETFSDPRRPGQQSKLWQRQLELLDWLEKAKAKGGTYLVLQARDVGVSTVLTGWGFYHTRELTYKSRKLVEPRSLQEKRVALYPGCKLVEYWKEWPEMPDVALVEWVEYVGESDKLPQAKCVIHSGGPQAACQGRKYDGVFVVERSARPDAVKRAAGCPHNDREHHLTWIKE
jgi:hypothetical protein